MSEQHNEARRRPLFKEMTVTGVLGAAIQTVAIMFTGFAVWVSTLKDVETNTKDIQENRQLIAEARAEAFSRSEALEVRLGSDITEIKTDLRRDIGDIKKDLSWLVRTFAAIGAAPSVPHRPSESSPESSNNDR